MSTSRDCLAGLRQRSLVQASGMPSPGSRGSEENLQTHRPGRPSGTSREPVASQEEQAPLPTRLNTRTAEKRESHKHSAQHVCSLRKGKKLKWARLERKRAEDARRRVLTGQSAHTAEGSNLTIAIECRFCCCTYRHLLLATIISSRNKTSPLSLLTCQMSVLFECIHLIESKSRSLLPRRCGLKCGQEAEVSETAVTLPPGHTWQCTRTFSLLRDAGGMGEAPPFTHFFPLQTACVWYSHRRVWISSAIIDLRS